MLHRNTWNNVTVYKQMIDIKLIVLWHINPFSGYVMPISVGLVVLCLHHAYQWNIEGLNSFIYTSTAFRNASILSTLTSSNIPFKLFIV